MRQSTGLRGPLTHPTLTLHFMMLIGPRRQGWGQFLKSIASFSGDLSAMTAPSFILSPVSLTEYPSYWGEHPDLFAKCSQGSDDIEKKIGRAHV